MMIMLCHSNMFIVVRLREDRRTPLHSWSSQMCKISIRILAASARILQDPWQVLRESLQQNAAAFANFNLKKFFKNIQKMVPKTPKSIKMGQNGARSKKITPRSEKDAKKGQAYTAFWTPLGIPNQPKSKKKGCRKSMFFRPPPGTNFVSF